MNDEFIMALTEMFFKREKDNKDAYLMIKSNVVLNIFYKLYNKLTLLDVPPIESLTSEEKTKYWDIAKRYYSDKDKAIKASKAAYILTLITNS